MADPDVLSQGGEDPREQEGKIFKPNVDAQARRAARRPINLEMLNFVREDFDFNPVKPWHISPLLRPPEPTPCKISLVHSRERRTFCDPKKPYRRMYKQVFGDLTVAESVGLGKCKGKGKGKGEGEGEGKD